MNLDPTIRDTLRWYAGRAPAGAGLLPGARAARARQRRRRRHLASAGLAAVVAAVAVAGWGIWPDRAGHGPVVALPPGAPVTLVPAEYAVPAVPLSPGWTPEEAGEPYAGYHAHGLADGPACRSELVCDRREPGFWLAHPHRDGASSSVISFDVSTADLSHLFAGRGRDLRTEAVTVQGRPATLYTVGTGHDGERAVAVHWRHRVGVWVTVYGDGAEELLRYADALTEEPFPITAPVAFTVLPADAELSYVTVSGITFNLAGGGLLSVHLGYDDGSGPVWGTSAVPPSAGPTDTPGVDPTTGTEIPTPQRLEIGGRPAEMVEYSDGTSMRIFLTDQQWVLSLYSTLSESDLRQVADGIELTETAQPQRIG
jgi:hypothetical protein